MTGRSSEEAAQAQVLRCIFGGPVRRLVPGPSLRGPTIISLAEAAYNDRILPGGHLDPHGLLILADALEEAGCNEVGLLSHLRSKEWLHVRGCWAVDAVSGRS